MLKKLFIFILFSTFFSQHFFAKEEKSEHTVMSCVINNFKRDMIYLDCQQTPLIRGEFYRNPGEEHILAFNTNKLVTMRLNGHELEFFLEPGDSLHAAIVYGERLPETITFSGTERAVRQNQFLWKLYRYRLSIHFKTSLNACVVLDHKPTDRIEATNNFATEAQKMLAANEKEYSQAFINYVEAIIEALKGESLIYYPDLYAGVRHKPINEQGLGDYWKLLDNYQIRTDEASLRCPQYIDFLLKYMVYKKASTLKDAQKSPSLASAMPQTLEASYKLAEETFKGAQLDAVLFAILARYISQGKNIDEAETWITHYKKNHNIEKEYVQILDSLMQ